MHSRSTLPAEGPIDAKILLVGLAPRESDIAQLKLFTDSDGAMLRTAVNEAGLVWDDLRKTTAVSYVLPKGKATDEDIENERPRVLAEISAMPNLEIVVLLGNEAMMQLLKKSGITKRRGEEVTINGVRYIPTFDPGYVVRRRARRTDLVRDLVRAKRLSEGIPFLDPAQAVTFAPQGQQISIGQYGAAVDVETDEHDKPRLLAVGSHPRDVVVLDARTARAQAAWEMPRGWWGHNLRADEVWLRHLDINLNGQKHDTMLMAHLLNENRSMSLKKLGLELLDPRLYWQYVEPLLHRPAQRGAIPYEELGTYCANDVAITLLLADRLSAQIAAPANSRLVNLYEHMSIPLSDVLLDMEWNGVQYDVYRAGVLMAKWEQECDGLAKRMDTLLGITGTNYGSHPQVRRILYTTLGLTAPHNTDSGEGSTDEKALMSLRDQHPFVNLLREWRRIDKKSQIVQSWLKRADINGVVRPRYNQASVTTGRLSGSDPNAQNVPTDKDIRSLIIARPGRKIVAADYKTIEMGTAAWIFQEASLLEAYTTQMEGDVTDPLDPRDLHTRTATSLLGRAPTSKDERKKYGKTPNFGLLYQQGDFGFREYAAKMGVEMPLEEAAHMRAAWHALYPGVRDGWRRRGNLMKQSGGTLTGPSGRMRRLPEFLSNRKMLVNEAWRQGCNFPVQCTAAEFTHCAAIIAHAELSAYGAHTLLHVHDSLVFEVDEAHVERWSKRLREIMEQDVPVYFETHFGERVKIPLRVDIGVGDNWGDA